MNIKTLRTFGYIILFLFWIVWLKAPDAFALSVSPPGYAILYTLLLLVSVFAFKFFTMSAFNLTRMIYFYVWATALLFTTMLTSWDLTTDLFLRAGVGALNGRIIVGVMFALVYALGNVYWLRYLKRISV